MIKIKEQPAKKNYFFEQGFVDLKKSVKMLWLKNSLAAKSCNAKYKRYGLMSIRGVRNLIMAVSIVFFGTLFFSILSLALASVLYTSSGIFYLCLFVVKFIDNMYLKRNKIFSVCYECKNKMDIPTYICPKCGRKHSNLSPSVYGILVRVCDCQHKLPTSFFNGRKKLDSICTICYENDNKEIVLNDRESTPFTISVIGASKVGKTAYINRVLREFAFNIANKKNIDIELMHGENINNFKSKDFNYYEPSDLTDDMYASRVYSFFAKNKSLNPQRLFHLFDIKGEAFEEEDKREIQRQYEYNNGYILMIDPFSIKSIKATYMDNLTDTEISNISECDTNSVADSFVNMLRDVIGITDNDILKTPLAIVINKIECADLMELFNKKAIDEAKKGKIDFNKSDAIDLLCRKLLNDNGMQAFVKMIDLRFKNNRYFISSSISDNVANKNSLNVIEPLEWIAKMSDEKFYEVWSDKKV